jgi:hypothetical protein
VAPVTGTYANDPVNHGSPFTPFSIPSHGTRDVEVTDHFGVCHGDPQAEMIVTRVPIMFRIFGVTRETWFTLPYSITASGVGLCER